VLTRIMGKVVIFFGCGGRLFAHLIWAALTGHNF